jgi:hypothetical protein
MQNSGRSNMKSVKDYLDNKDTVYIRVYKILRNAEKKMISISARRNDIGYDSVNLFELLTDTLKNIGGKFLIEQTSRDGVFLSLVIYADGSMISLQRTATVAELKSKGHTKC